jgi:5-methyltetrahydrofolate--homocysteine methyltransferase
MANVTHLAFSQDRWTRIQDNAAAWWAGKLRRPLVQMRLHGYPTALPTPRLPGIARATFYDLSVPVSDIVERWAYDLSRTRFLGDSFPHLWPDLGPGVAATFMGAVAEPTPETVWFHPGEIKGIHDIRLTHNPRQVWIERIRDLSRAVLEHWEGMVQCGMTDLGGNLDILSVFRPGESLLTDLYDAPDQVKRLTWESHNAWWQAFEDINRVLQPRNPGYTSWAPIFSRTPCYMLQCDFSYMIGPDMFDEFVKPELVTTCRKLDHAFYHLDGIGQLPHLDSLLSMPDLDGIQWVPGTGRPGEDQWAEVYGKIRDSGKKIQTFHWDLFDRVVGSVGSPGSFVVLGSAPASRENDVREFLRRHHVPEEA